MRIVDLYRRTYRGLGPDVWRLAAVTFVHRSGTMVLPFVALYATDVLGTSAGRAGGILALYGVGSILGAWGGGRLSDAIGPYRAQLWSLLVAGVCLIGLQWIRDPLGFALAMVPTALAAESFRPSSSAALAALARPENRSRVFALRRLAINAGMTIGPAIGGLLAAVDYAWLFRLDGLTCFAAAAVLAHSFRDGRLDVVEAPETSPAPLQGADPRGPSAWSDRGYLLLLLLVALTSIVFFQLMSTWPLTLRDLHGLDEPRIGLLFAANTVLIVLFEMPLVAAAERIAPLRVAALGAVFVGLGLGPLPWAPWAAPLLGTIVLWTIGEMLVFPSLESLAAGRAPARRRGQYLGLYTACFSVAFLVGPLVGTRIYEDHGAAVLWVGTGIASLFVAAALLALDRGGLVDEHPAAPPAGAR